MLYQSAEFVALFGRNLHLVVGEHLRKTHYRIERRAHLMAHILNEPNLHFIGFFGSFARLHSFGKRTLGALVCITKQFILLLSLKHLFASAIECRQRCTHHHKQYHRQATQHNDVYLASHLLLLKFGFCSRMLQIVSLGKHLHFFGACSGFFQLQVFVFYRQLLVVEPYLVHFYRLTSLGKLQI